MCEDRKVELIDGSNNLKYLRWNTVERQSTSKKLKCQAARYILIDEVLYRLGNTLPFLQYLDKDEVNYVQRESYKGIFGNHSGARSLVIKVCLFSWLVDHFYA